jgi:hypothetical protein
MVSDHDYPPKKKKVDLDQIRRQLGAVKSRRAIKIRNRAVQAAKALPHFPLVSGDRDVIPADHKWFRNLAVSQIADMVELHVSYPKPTVDLTEIRCRYQAGEREDKRNKRRRPRDAGSTRLRAFHPSERPR